MLAQAAALVALAASVQAQDVPTSASEKELDSVEQQYENSGFDEALPGKSPLCLQAYASNSTCLIPAFPRLPIFVRSAQPASPPHTANNGLCSNISLEAEALLSVAYGDELLELGEDYSADGQSRNWVPHLHKLTLCGTQLLLTCPPSGLLLNKTVLKISRVATCSPSCSLTLQLSAVQTKRVTSECAIPFARPEGSCS